MSKHSEYVCHSKIVAIIEQSNFGLQALRLFHSLWFFADEIPNCLISMALPDGRAVRVHASEVTALVGPVHANGLDSVREAFIELKASKLCDIFDWEEESNEIIFRFSTVIAKAAVRYKKDRFAMIDTEALQTCRTPEQILFYTGMKLAENSRYPIINIPGVDPMVIPPESKGLRK